IPLTKVKLINELNEREADLGVKESVSWHSEYKDSAWIFVGGFPYELTEGDLICVFSQYVPAQLTCPAVTTATEGSLRVSGPSGTEKSSTSTWFETRRRENPKVSASSATRINAVPSWPWTTSTASRYPGSTL
uniref:RRM domain-containing protein n=1 Tax=Amphiprion ocellaris TaxID=80972 RepID=A0A3Q1CII5_AMPOC